MRHRYRSVVAATAMFGALVGIATSAWSANVDNSDDVKPYSGKPIFLREPEPEPPASLVERQVSTAKYDNGTVRIERQIARYSDDHREADGFYREYFPNGQLFAEGQHQAGLQVDKWTYWHENGQKSHEISFVDGQPDGSTEVYRADGTLSAKRNFKNGKRDGVWMIYDDTGKQPLRQESYEVGKMNGEWKFWFPSGQIQRQIGFKDGKRDGPALEWNEKGDPLFEVTYNEGKLDGTATAWTPDGKKVVRRYDDGKLVKESQP